MAEKYELKTKEVWDGNTAASHALRQAQVDVIAAYPITPSTPIVQNYAQYLADGYVDGEFVMVESEHSAMSACVGASAAGGRMATATSSQGFALMVEVLYQASGMRMPIVLQVVNRALEELVKAGLVQKEIEEPAKRTSKVYYSLTELGKEAIKVYEYVEELEKKRKSHIAIENSKDVYFAVGDNNIVAKNVNIKK